MIVVFLPSIQPNEKARCGIEGEVLYDRAEALRVERQDVLQPLYRIDQQHSDKVKGQQGGRIIERALLALRINVGEIVEGTFERAHEPRQEVALTADDPDYEFTERNGREHDEHKRGENLHPADERHKHLRDAEANLFRLVGIPSGVANPGANSAI
jgi:hypothetical protein